MKLLRLCNRYILSYSHAKRRIHSLTCVWFKRRRNLQACNRSRGDEGLVNRMSTEVLCEGHGGPYSDLWAGETSRHKQIWSVSKSKAPQSALKSLLRLPGFALKIGLLDTKLSGRQVWISMTHSSSILLVLYKCKIRKKFKKATSHIANLIKLNAVWPQVQLGNSKPLPSAA